LKPIPTPFPPGGLAVDSPPSQHDIRRFSHEAMATVYEVYAVHPDEQYAAQAAQAAFDLVDRLERELSRFQPNSDITRINQLAAGAHTRVTPTTLECLVIARHMFELTGGVFDVSIGTGLPSLEIDPDELVVRASTSGVQIDLGGIGKGYAVDLVAELLEDWDLERSLVHGGFSSLLALEPPAGIGGWPLTLSDPRDSSRVLARLSVSQTALGASGVRKKDHIVDPRSGEPVRGRLASWVAVPRPRKGEQGERGGPGEQGEGPRLAAAAVADALTTAFMMMSVEEIDELCARTPGVEAWLLPDDDERAVGHFGGSGAS
jgi:thiamine biosynthesis lipoprotein